MTTEISFTIFLHNYDNAEDGNGNVVSVARYARAEKTVLRGEPQAVARGDWKGEPVIGNIYLRDFATNRVCSKFEVSHKSIVNSLSITGFKPSSILYKSLTD